MPDPLAAIDEMPRELLPARLPNLTTLSVDDFADTARVLLELDAVVTIDTAVAHLAGTLGRPTHLLLVHPAHPIADGRWSERPPLYPARSGSRARIGRGTGRGSSRPFATSCRRWT